MSLSSLRRLLVLGLILGPLGIACSNSDEDEDEEDELQDSDGDGLTDDVDPDPDNADADGDGIEDGDEVELGTDPTEVDSDGDGYEDGWEVTEETDPTDAESVIYTGGWPYNPDKDSIEDPGWGDTAESGVIMPRFAWSDQFGEAVDIYDFAMQGKPIVIDLSGLWCYWCHEMAKWLEGDTSNAYHSSRDSYDWYDVVPELVDNGDIYWVTVIDGDQSGGAPDQDDVDTWYSYYPNSKVAVLLDEAGDLTDWLNPSGYPTVILIEEDMTVGVYRRNDYTKVFDKLVERYAE